MERTIVVTGDVLLQGNLLVSGTATDRLADGLRDLAVQSSADGAGRIVELEASAANA